MNIRQLPLQYALVLMLLLICTNAFSNGINPPRPRQAPISVICVDKTNSFKYELFRVRVKIGESYHNSLTTQMHGNFEEIPIKNINTITFSTDNVDRYGFLKSTLLLNHSRKVYQVNIKVKAIGGNVRLSGFKKDGIKYNLEMSKCKIVKFNSSISNNNYFDSKAKL